MIPEAQQALQRWWPNTSPPPTGDGPATTTVEGDATTITVTSAGAYATIFDYVSMIRTWTEHPRPPTVTVLSGTKKIHDTVTLLPTTLTFTSYVAAMTQVTYTHTRTRTQVIVVTPRCDEM
jgi:hypothetical protein